MKNYDFIHNVIEKLGYGADPMTIWVGRDASVGEAKGYIIYDHKGLGNIRKDFKDFKVYALRESDELNGDPATIENMEVVVNFFGYFITEEDLDWAFAKTDFQPIYDWDYDPWDM